MLNCEAIERAFLAACRAELSALKPGNVHTHAGGHGMEVADFEKSAIAAAPRIADPHLTVGGKILSAVTATWHAVGCNTNLGIVLLCAPLAKAAELHASAPHTAGAENLRDDLSGVLHSLTVADAVAAYRAIAIMNPAGLGHVAEADVSATPTVTLREAMALAGPRDRIANTYVTDFAEIFEFALPRLRAALTQAETRDLAVTTLHMSLLAQLPDSHISRKYGLDAAEAVRREAASLSRHWSPFTQPASLAPLLEFDASLKKQRLNPGTTADLVVATLFVNAIEAEIAALGRI